MEDTLGHGVAENAAELGFRETGKGGEIFVTYCPVQRNLLADFEMAYGVE
jgi:hypothetical protein